MSKSKFYWSDDYAGLEANGIRFYYGYEVTLEDEWCFEMSKDGKVLATIPASKLGKVNNPDEPPEMLMAGIRQMIDSGVVRFEVTA